MYRKVVTRVDFVDSVFNGPEKGTTMFALETGIQVFDCSFRCGSEHFVNFMNIGTHFPWLDIPIELQPMREEILRLAR